MFCLRRGNVQDADSLEQDMGDSDQRAVRQPAKTAQKDHTQSVGEAQTRELGRRGLRLDLRDDRTRVAGCIARSQIAGRKSPRNLNRCPRPPRPPARHPSLWLRAGLIRLAAPCGRPHDKKPAAHWCDQGPDGVRVCRGLAVGCFGRGEARTGGPAVVLVGHCCVRRIPPLGPAR